VLRGKAVQLFYAFLCESRIAEREKQWEMKMKEDLARKALRIRATRCDRDKMIAEVSIQH